MQTKTLVRHKHGGYALGVIILFIIMFPFGLCAIPLLPFLFTKRTKWMKDTEHIDPISGHLVGVYRKGRVDAPRKISFYREPDYASGEEEIEEESFDELSHRQIEGRGNRRKHGNVRRARDRQSHPSHKSSQSRRFSGEYSRLSRSHQDEYNTTRNEPIRLHIYFKDKPVQLPDGVCIIKYRIF